MRAGPAGVLYSDEAEQRKQVAIDQGRITHADPRAIAGAVAVATAVALAGKLARVDRTLMVDMLCEQIASIDDRFAFALSHLTDWLRLSPDAAAIEIAEIGMVADKKRKWAGISPFVTSSVLWALYSFLRSPDDYWETILTAIGAGGDADTTAAMAGAIAGARLGPAAIPSELASRIHDQGTWRANDLQRLASSAARVVYGSGRLDGSSLSIEPSR